MKQQLTTAPANRGMTRAQQGLVWLLVLAAVGVAVVLGRGHITVLGLASQLRQRLDAPGSAPTVAYAAIATIVVMAFNGVLLLVVRRRYQSAYARAYAEAAAHASQLEDTNAKLVEANETKQRFISMVSHELRTPLTVIRGLAETLHQHGDTIEVATRETMAATIVRQSRRQQRMIEDLLVVARHAGSPPLPDRVIFETQDVMLNLVPDLTDELRTRVRWPSDSVTLWADPRHLEQMLENLLTNAGKYGGPTIWVRWERQDDGHVVVAVEDDGPGVLAPFTERMFEEFSQADEGDTRSSRGFGLGLSITRALVRANDGEVRYRHRDGGGARFELHLPGAAQRVAQLSDALSASVGAGAPQPSSASA